MLKVVAKTLGRKAFIEREIMLPAGLVSLRELIGAIVQQETHAFNSRQQDQTLTKVLTARQIAESTEQGKFVMGGQEAQTADPEQTVHAAWQAFEDGLYFVFLDDQQQTVLDAPLPILKDNARLMFVRLIALAGG